MKPYINSAFLRQIALSFVASVFTTSIASCGSQTDFAGGGAEVKSSSGTSRGTTKTVPPAPGTGTGDVAVQPGTPADPSAPASDCTTSQTVVTLMSNSFVNNAKNQYIQYKLSQKDCHGNVMAITANDIRFDVNAKVSTGARAIPFAAYLVTNPSQPLASGSLQTVSGQDLFGVVDKDRWYYSTNNQITIPASTYEIYFSLDYSCTVMHSSNPGSYPATEVIDSYLAFGSATPVTQKLQVTNSQLSGACR